MQLPRSEGNVRSPTRDALRDPGWIWLTVTRFCEGRSVVVAGRCFHRVGGRTSASRTEPPLHRRAGSAAQGRSRDCVCCCAVGAAFARSCVRQNVEKQAVRSLRLPRSFERSYADGRSNSTDSPTVAGRAGAGRRPDRWQRNATMPGSCLRRVLPTRTLLASTSSGLLIPARRSRHHPRPEDDRR